MADMQRRRVVITGVGAITPLGLTVAETWQRACAGESGIGSITHFDAAGFETRIAGEVKGFDPAARFDRRDARRMDRFCQFAVAAAIDAVADAQLDAEAEDRDRIGVLVGSGIGGIKSLSDAVEVLVTKGPNRVSPLVIPMLIHDMASGMIAMHFHVHGPNHGVVSACTTGAHALGEAAEIIRRGAADVMIAGGTEAAIVPIGVAGFNNMKATSRRNDEPTRASRPFDAERDGFVIAEGSAVVVLESEEHAVRRDAPILGELLGYGDAADAYDMVMTPEDGSGLRRAIERAIRDARLDPSAIGYVNAHGTSTKYNDISETSALKAIFGDRVPPVSSTKSMTGHLLGAAGSLEAVFSLLALRDGVLPPTMNYENPDPQCDLDYIPNEARHLRVEYVLSNNSGFGGHNTALVFGRYDG